MIQPQFSFMRSSPERGSECVSVMARSPDEVTTEEPQEDRGRTGSRDTGLDDPSGGSADRPSGTGDADSDTGINPQLPSDPDAPNLQSGDG